MLLLLSIVDLLVALGVLCILLFAGLIVWDMSDMMSPCAVPYCGKFPSQTVRVGAGAHAISLCRVHFEKLLKRSKYTNEGTSRPFFTEERKRRMFTPTVEEKRTMNNLVKKGILEHTLIGGKPYKPTMEFANAVAKAKTSLLFNRCVFDLRGMTEEGTKIAMKQTLKKVTLEKIEEYSEIACPFVYWEEMDRELHPHKRKTLSIQKQQMGFSTIRFRVNYFPHHTQSQDRDRTERYVS